MGEMHVRYQQWTPILSPTAASRKVVLLVGGQRGWMDGKVCVCGGWCWRVGGQLLGRVLELTDERDDGQILSQQL